ncbi:hypothetical protein [sulfur-oxidizing endosymbiont of Gigantopelta aegis]|uniref:hypothetical protein n=1 Tax=sulfur-oxidizing endosymbiont of Gigantopelta aegis TaxID=2794934 RepID=UPI0018DD1B75|nr:hypothetical protein [sulfur-oxidizing endosymbiont of Gigantopelta aegis]
MNTFEYIKNWTSYKESFSFFLPEGSEGRPFDNQYEIIDIKKINNTMSIQLTENIKLCFEGDIKYNDEGCNLIIFNFKKLKYIVNGVLDKEFSDGEFCLTGF